MFIANSSFYGFYSEKMLKFPYGSLLEAGSSQWILRALYPWIWFMDTFLIMVSIAETLRTKHLWLESPERGGVLGQALETENTEAVFCCPKNIVKGCKFLTFS